MYILIGILVAFVAVVALITWITDILSSKKQGLPQEEKEVEIPMDCCGAHEVCEFEEMLQNPNEIVYFEDEELDRFRGVQSEQYNDNQIDEFRDVLYTLKGDEVRMWLLSIERRQLQLPNILRQEALMLIADA
ncbi:hypothetical protein [Mangrovibacterium lignilyticum]|uniref:hypothetical protein n=1 Tax=Mangrovibacterium lignilyticum TaxID=2668052 RepID=UPI0013D62DC1|nr:hypothetical protein [Mangrovibacterium lignilyticum]